MLDNRRSRCWIRIQENSSRKTLEHDGEELRKFYSGLTRPVLVGIEATGSMQWFLELMEELSIECRVGDPAKIRAAEPRKQKNDRRDAQLLLKLLSENRFPTIWMPSSEQRDLRTLLRNRHQCVKIRTRVQNTLQAMALSHALRRGRGLWTATGQISQGNARECARRCAFFPESP